MKKTKAYLSEHPEVADEITQKVRDTPTLTQKEKKALEKEKKLRKKAAKADKKTANKPVSLDLGKDEKINF